MAQTEKSGGTFGPLEAVVMDAVWNAGEAVAVRTVVDKLNSERTEPLAYTTVMTVMVRLSEKGDLRRRKKGRGFLYRASAADPAGLAVRRVLDTYGDAAVVHFVDTARADPEVMRRLRAILNEADG